MALTSLRGVSTFMVPVAPRAVTALWPAASPRVTCSGSQGEAASFSAMHIV